MRPRNVIPFAAIAALLLAGAASTEAKKHNKRQAKHKRSQGVHINLGHWAGFGGPRLGAQVQPLTDDLRTFFGAKAGEGVLVGKVLPGLAAAKAGMRAGDVVVSIDGTSVASLGDIWSTLRSKKQGDKVKVGIVRNKRRKTLTATVQGVKGSPMVELNHVLKQLDALKNLDVDIDLPDIIMQMSKGTIHIPPMGKIHMPDIDFDLSGVPDVQRQQMKRKLDAAEKRLQKLEQRLKRLERKRKTK